MVILNNNTCFLTGVSPLNTEQQEKAIAKLENPEIERLKS